MSSLHSEIPIQCQECQQFYLRQNKTMHENIHRKPVNIAPTSLPNQTKKLGLIDLTDATDNSDPATRSILPGEDDAPCPQTEKKQIKSPWINDQSDRTAIKFQRDVVVSERLDLDTNMVNTDIVKDEVQALNIQKPVDLRPQKAVVTRKQVHKYKNSHASQETVDAGMKQGKIVLHSNPVDNSQNDEVVYEMVEEPKSLIGSNNKPSVIPIGLKKSALAKFVPVNTKCNETQLEKRQRVSIPPQPSPVKPDISQSAEQPLHPNECPSCHGFYCKQCKSDLPPTLRPFWDSSESEEMKRYYMNRQKKALQNYTEKCQHQKPKIEQN